MTRTQMLLLLSSNDTNGKIVPLRPVCSDLADDTDATHYSVSPGLATLCPDNIIIERKVTLYFISGSDGGIELQDILHATFRVTVQGAF